MIKEGDNIPSVKFRERHLGGWIDTNTDMYFKGKKVILFSLPGAFTPTCSSKQLPGFEENAKEFKKYGIDAYFTGCLTLLFDDVTEKTGGKYLVDVNTKCNYIPDVKLNTSKYNDFQIIEHDINNKIKYKKPLDVCKEQIVEFLRS